MESHRIARSTSPPQVIEALPKASIGRLIVRNFRAAIIALDILLQRLEGIREYTDWNGCLLRIAWSKSPRDLQLADGTEIRKGERIVELHFWNENFPPMPDAGPNFTWALQYRRQIVGSLRQLAAFVEREPSMHDINCFHGDSAVGSQRSFIEFSELAERWGFEVISNGDGVWERMTQFWKSLYTMGLIWAHNPKNMTCKGLWTARRDQIWISRKSLLERYGKGQTPSKSGSDTAAKLTVPWRASGKRAAIND